LAPIARAAAAALTSCVLGSSGAHAAPCAGFIDVDDASAFCTSVQWVKNRAITTGCALANSYCPAEPVSRLAMAAFLARLGKAVEPYFVVTSNAAAAAGVNANGVVCQTPMRDFAEFPRIATAQGVLYHGAASSWTVSTL
jgi:acyl-[acyl carrier protein]--UDP-N-acetylglucosamine O-acyltransferase